MRAAIYGRRSTEEHQAASLDVQLDEARRFIAAHGWTHDGAHAFLDDAISRAEFKKRPALLAMLLAAVKRSFDVVVVRDESRLGGDTFRGGLVIQDIIESGTRLFYYSSGEEVQLETAVDKFMIAARSFASELEREKIASRTREHLQNRARRGYNVGGRCFGYDNMRGADAWRHVEYRINESEAGIVRSVFERYAGGVGVRTVAQALNDERAPPPRAGKRGTGSWAPSQIWCMLRNERYRGRIVWGREGKAYKGGTKIRVAHPESRWVTIDVEELRIIDEELWQAVSKRLENNRRVIEGRARGTGGRPRHLLSGLARCGQCGGPMQVANSKSGPRIIKVYTCGWRRDRGASVCKNTMRRPMTLVNEAVVTELRDKVLTERMVRLVLSKLRTIAREQTVTRDERLPAMEDEARQLRRELDNLTGALAAAPASHALIEALGSRERRLHTLQIELEAARLAPRQMEDAFDALEIEALARLGDVAQMIERTADGARKTVERLFDEPLKMTPRKDGRFEITGRTSLGNLLFHSIGDPDGSQYVRNLRNSMLVPFAAAG